MTVQVTLLSSLGCTGPSSQSDTGPLGDSVTAWLSCGLPTSQIYLSVFLSFVPSLVAIHSPCGLRAQDKQQILPNRGLIP